MRNSKAIARISQLKGQVFCLQHNQFHLLDVNDYIYANDLLLVDFQATVLINYFDKQGEYTKQLLPADNIFLFQLASRPLADYHIERLTRRIEEFVPTANGESSSAHGVYLVTVDNRQYESTLLKPLSLAQIHAIEQLAALSVRCAQGMAYQFSEEIIVSALQKQGYNSEQIISLQQPAHGRISQRENTQLLYFPDNKAGIVDIFHCTYLTDKQMLNNAVLLLRLETEQVELSVLSVAQTDVDDFDALYKPELITPGDDDIKAIEQDIVDYIKSQPPLAFDMEEELESVDLIEPTSMPMTYAVHSPLTQQLPQEVFVIDNFNPADCLELYDLDDNVDDLSSYLRISLRQNPESLSSIVEVSYTGNIAANDVNQCVVIHDVDLTNGLDNQEEIIDSLMDSGNLIVNFKQVA